MWRTFAEGCVTLNEDGTVATQTGQAVDSDGDNSYSLTTTGTELTEGKHYWEVEILSEVVSGILIGITRPDLRPEGAYFRRKCTDGWFIGPAYGGLWGNGKYGDDDNAGGYIQGDRVGVLLDLNDGSLRFFKNGVQHGPGYAAGSVTGPVVAAAQMLHMKHSLRLLPNAEAPANA
jgi:hypothetical protein